MIVRLQIACPVAGCNWTAGANPNDPADTSWWLLVDVASNNDATARAQSIYQRTHVIFAHHNQLSVATMPVITEET